MKYREFLEKFVEGIFEGKKLVEYKEDLLSYVEKTENNFTSYLRDVNKIIEKYKLNSNFLHYIPRIRDHMHDETLRKILTSYRKGKESEENVELILALTLAHAISHYEARSVKLNEDAAEEATEALNRYLEKIGVKKKVGLHHLQTKEPGDLFEMVKNNQIKQK